MAKKKKKSIFRVFPNKNQHIRPWLLQFQPRLSIGFLHHICKAKQPDSTSTTFFKRLCCLSVSGLKLKYSAKDRNQTAFIKQQNKSDSSGQFRDKKSIEINIHLSTCMPWCLLAALRYITQESYSLLSTFLGGDFQDPETAIDFG